MRTNVPMRRAIGEWCLHPVPGSGRDPVPTFVTVRIVGPTLTRNLGDCPQNPANLALPAVHSELKISPVSICHLCSKDFI